MIEHGRIVNIEDNQAKVQVLGVAECEKCSLCCSKIGGQHMLSVPLEPGQDFAVGEKVEIEISAGETLFGGFLVFIAPLFAFIIGAIFGKAIFSAFSIGIEDDLAALSAGLFFLIVTLAFAVIVYRSKKRQQKLTPKIHRTYAE